MMGDQSPENEEEASERRIREAQERLEKPKIEALKSELISLRDHLDPENVFGKESFLKQFEETLERARRFVTAIYPPPLP